MIGTKTCNKCGNEYERSPEFFHRCKKSSDGLRGTCKTCRKIEISTYAINNKERIKQYKKNYHAQNKERLCEKTRIWSSNNKERKAEYDRRYNVEHRDKRREQNNKWAKNNSEKVRAASRRYYEKHRDKHLEACHRWINNHKDRMRENGRRWRINNPDKNRAKTARRRALKLNAEGKHTPEDTKKQYEAQKGKCWWCLQPVMWGEHHVDHRVPLTRGGGNGPGNLVISCAHCNLSKSNKLPDEFAGRLL